MEQKQVKLIGLKVLDNNVIKAVELTPDIMSKRLIQIVGESGNGKTTLVESLKTSIGGMNAVAKKDALAPGFLTEAQLTDGEIKIFVGVRKRELTKGERQGDSVVETFLYAKNDEGEMYTPIIDGESATAAKYVKLLTTDLTFSMPALFTENQTVHRKLIESLFKEELDGLGADEVVARIMDCKQERDAARVMCSKAGAFMENFEREGLSEAHLQELSRVDVDKIEADIREAEIERDRILRPADAAYELKCNKIREEYQTRLRAAEKAYDAAVTAEKDEKRRLKDEYAEAEKKYNEQEERKTKWAAYYENIKANAETFFYNTEELAKVKEMIEARYKVITSKFTLAKPELAAPAPKFEGDVINTKAELDATKAEEALLKFPEKAVPDTKAVDAKIADLKASKEKAERENELFDRYAKWCAWIEAKGKYEKELNTLRKMYERINTGVEGLKIVPNATDTDKIEVWIMYDGRYDKDFFLNPNGESRYIFQYSSFQRSAIGVMLQAARLNLKPKALRLAIVDDVAFTQKGLAVLSKLCTDLDVQLITCRTDDIDRSQVKDGEVLMENGEAFFKK